MKIALKNVRLAFPKLFKAESVNGGDPAFGAVFLMAPDHPTVKEIKAAIEKVGEAKWGAKWPQIKKGLETQDRLALHDGDTKAETSGYEGNLFINAGNKTRPLVIDRDKSPLDSADGKPYGGCYVNASIELWAQDNQFGKRINASLRGVQFLKDGDAFTGGGAASDDEFDDLAADELEEDPLMA